MTIVPSFVHFWPAIRRRRFLMGSGKDGDRAASNRSSTALDTLLMFRLIILFVLNYVRISSKSPRGQTYQ